MYSSTEFYGVGIDHDQTDSQAEDNYVGTGQLVLRFNVHNIDVWYGDDAFGNCFLTGSISVGAFRSSTSVLNAINLFEELIDFVSCIHRRGVAIHGKNVKIVLQVKLLQRRCFRG